MNPERSVAEQANALVELGKTADAVATLEQGVQRDLPDACFTLAAWTLAGRWVDRDMARSRALFAQASRNGHPLAQAIHAAFVANGTGGERDWGAALSLLQSLAATDGDAMRQLDLIGRMKLTQDGEPAVIPTGRPLGETFAPTRFEGAFSKAECDYLIEAASPLFQASTVVHPATGQLVPDPVRTSDAAAFPLVRENPAVHALNRRLAAMSGTDVTQGEPLQVLRYRPGQQYKLHSDALPGAANQRIYTALIYLNEQYEGGETVFPASGLSIRGRMGDAILFRNVDPNGAPEPRANHIGAAVTGGTKFIGSRWIRQAPLDLTQPRRPAA